jgi:hypothetical protein
VARAFPILTHLFAFTSLLASCCFFASPASRDNTEDGDRFPVQDLNIAR